jgi:hypothetical protein
MRTTRNWGMIHTGETFEALATTLIFFQDSGARLFGARGADGGQDARSGDGETVLQAKHHVKPTASKAIADAKREAEKVAKYRAAGHPRSSEWATVQHWILVTNASFGPTDEATWQTEVAPEFAKVGLTAKYWEEATLDGFLDKHPEVDRAFFQNETRVFLSPTEACLRVADDDPFTQRVDLAPYVGRQSELAALDAFLVGGKSYLHVHAAGGIGKTRFLLEGACQIAARGDWQVLWANVHSMGSSSNWFDAIVPERPTLLVVDDPDDERLIQRIKEQIGRRGERAQQWKVAIAVRSTNDPILQALQHPNLKRWVDELMLSPLATAECEEMCRKLFESGKLAKTDSEWRDETTKILARRFDGYPIWLSLAVHLLEEEGSLAKLPTTASGLCQRYLDEALKPGQADEKLLQLVRWVALLGPINREDDTEVQHLSEHAGYAGLPGVREALKRLASGRLLRRWGANDRLVDVKPDVLRDFILRGWFCEERDYGERRYVPSEAAKALSEDLSRALSDGTAGKREERVLAALARVDFLLRHENDPADLGTSLFGALNSALPSMTPRQRTAMIQKVSVVGPYYPEAVVQILRRLRLENAGEETVEGFGRTRTYSHNDVVLNLAYAHHRVARGMLTDRQATLAFDELYALLLEERRLAGTLRYGLPNDGKRAESVIRNLLESGPSYVREFGDVAADVVLRELGSDAKDTFRLDRLLALQAIVKPLCDVQRHQTWSEGHTIQMRTQLLFEGHANRKGAAKVLARVRSIIEQGAVAVDDEARAVLWDMLSDAHKQANFAKGQLVGESDAIEELNTQLFDNLKWVQAVLDQRAASPRELRAAREFWRWHFEFAKDDELGALATQLEGKYISDPMVQLFEGLIDWDQPEETRRKVDSKAGELADAGTAAIEEFLAQAVKFFGNEDMQRIFSVASTLGRLAITHESVRSFIVDGFKNYHHGTAGYQFIIAGVADWVAFRRRESSDAAAQLVKDLLAVGTPAKQVHLLKVLYLVSYCHDQALLNSRSEIDLLRTQKSLFAESNCLKDYVGCTLWGLRHDWVGLKANLEDAFQGASRDVRGSITTQVVKRLHEMLAAGVSSTLPSDLLQWLWNQLVETHDLGHLKHEGRWYLGEIIKALGKVPMAWLVDAVQRRAAWDEQAGWNDYDPPAELVPLVELVTDKNVGQPEVQRAIGDLVALLSESPVMEYWLPKLLARVDPQGLEVPRRVAALTETDDDPEKVGRLVRTACYYRVGTPSWRHIARGAFKSAHKMTKEERLHVYYATSETGHRSWSAPAGTVAQCFLDAVETATRGLQEEQEPDFVPFWEWRKERAEAELRDRQEKLKEEQWD